MIDRSFPSSYLPDVNYHSYLLKDQEFLLLPQKAIYWTNKKCLLLSDIHLGKAGHFRKSGIPIPRAIHDHDLQIMEQLLATFQPKTVLFLGDLFHSEVNSEWWHFTRWLDGIKGINFLLVKGNHDVFNSQLAHRRLKIFEDHLDLGPFRFCHKPAPTTENGRYYISGHIHPAVKLRGKRRQSVTCPCFYFGQYQALLPAFGQFTGYVKISPQLADDVFLVAEEQVFVLKK